MIQEVIDAIPSRGGDERKSSAKEQNVTEILDRYRSIADDLTARVEAVPDSAWDNQSPCAEWSARGVMAHVIDVAHGAVDALDGVTHVPVAADALEPAKDWAGARERIESALADPQRAGTLVDSPFGQVPFAALVDQLLRIDTLIHTWDLARATGGDERIDADAAAETLQALSAIPDAMLRDSGAFGPAIPAPADADAVTALMCFAGRRA
jgi:uncharacterized protein (TIGR03086 family)